MEKNIISFLGGLNTDDNGIQFPEGDYKSANNIIIETDDGGNGVAIKKMKSMGAFIADVSGDFTEPEYVQSCRDTEDTVYLLIKGKLSGVLKARILKLKAAEITTLINNYDYQNCTIVPDMVIVGDRLIWNFCGEGVPLMIRTTLANLTPSYKELTLIKAPPILQLSITENAGNSYSNFTDHFYQFAGRYVYNDKEVSVLGPISKLSSGVDLVKSITVNLNENEVIPSISHVDRIEYYVRDGNDGVWFLIEGVSLTKSNKSITFTGLKSIALSASESSKQFDFIPYASKNIEAVNNLILLGNNDELLAAGDGSTPISVTSKSMATNSFTVSALTVTNDGAYTTVPSVTISGGGGSGATGTVILNLGGSYYTTASVTFSGGYVNATGTATVSGGKVTGITVTSAGGYSNASPPVITITGDGSGAFAVPIMTSMVGFPSLKTVSSVVIISKWNGIQLTNGGSGYTSEPTVTIGNGISGNTMLVSATITSLNQNFSPDSYAYYNPSRINGAGFSTDLEEETKPFANDSSYEVGYLLLDDFMRTRGVESTVQFTTTAFGFNKFNVNITKKEAWPSWAKYFQVAITKNLNKDFIYEGYADTCYFLAETKEPNTSSNTAIVADSRKESLQAERNYRAKEAAGTLTEQDRKDYAALVEGVEYGDAGTFGGGLGVYDYRTESAVIVPYEITRPDKVPETISSELAIWRPSSLVQGSDIRSKIKYLVFDISSMFSAERYYSFQENDLVIAKFGSSDEFQQLKVVGQDGPLILCDPSPLMNLSALNSTLTQMYFEIYSPAEANQSKIFYATGDVRSVDEISGSTGQVSYLLEGDCYYNGIELPYTTEDRLSQESAKFYSRTANLDDQQGALSVRTYSNNSINLNYGALGDVSQVGKCVLTDNTGFDDDLWKLDGGYVLVNTDGLYTITWKLNVLVGTWDFTTLVTPYIATNVQLALFIDGESVKYSDFQNVQTLATGPLEFESTANVYLYAGDKVTISIQKSDDYLENTPNYRIASTDFSLEISQSPISLIPFAPVYRKNVVDTVDKKFIIKSLSKSGKIDFKWNKDHGKPYTKYLKIESETSYLKNRIRWSGRYVDGSNLSRLSSFSYDSATDLPIEIGKINALVRTSDQQTNGTVVLAMGDKDTFSLYIDRNMVSTSSGEQLTTQSNEVINNIYPLKGGFGCVDKKSIVRKNGRVFFWDRSEKMYVRYSSEGLEPLDKKVNNYLKDKTSVNAAFYDPFYDIVFVNFSDSQTLAWSDKLKRWISEFDMKFDGSYYIDNNAYLIQSKKTSSNIRSIPIYKTLVGEGYNSFLGAGGAVSKIKLTHNSLMPINVGHIQIKTHNWLDWNSHEEQ